MDDANEAVVTVVDVKRFVDLSPDTVEGDRGDQIALTAIVTNALGDEVDEPVEFDSSDENVATVDEAGVVTLVAMGQCVITATHVASGATDSSGVVVSDDVRKIVIVPDSYTGEVGDETKFKAYVYDGAGNPLPDAEVVFSSSDELGMTIDPVTGEAQLLKAGTYRAIANMKPAVDPVPPPIDPPVGDLKLMFEDDFSSGDLSKGKVDENGDPLSIEDRPGPWWAIPNRVDVVDMGGFHAARFSYPVKPNYPENHNSWSELAMRWDQLPEHPSAVTVEYDLLVPGDVEFRPELLPSNNKFLRFHMTAKNARELSVTTEFRPQDAQVATSRVLGITDGPKVPSATLISPDGPVRPGEWVRIRVELATSTGPGEFDGLYRLSVDGTPVLTYGQHVIWNWVGKPRSFFSGLYVLGWANNGYPEPTEYHIANFRLYEGVLGR